MQPYDVIVLGLGGMGSAAAYHLAGRGVRVLGLERFGVAHHLGSSHGYSRIIRQSYYEDPAYVPLLQRAYELWGALEQEANAHLLTMTGGLMIGAPESPVVTGSLRSAQEHGLPHELLDAAELRRRFPALNPGPGTVALFEERAGYLHPEESVRAHLEQAAARGATLHFDEPVTAWEAAPSGDGVRVVTTRGSYEAARLVIAPGSWAPGLLRDLGLPLAVTRQLLCWFAPTIPDHFAPGALPIYIWDPGQGGDTFYGFPTQPGPPGGAKVAIFDMGDPPCDPDHVNREVALEAVARVRRTVAPFLPALPGELIATRTCLYTMTPDHHFVIATHPNAPQVALACGFSGHGYKFASVVGEILADLALTGSTSHPIALFRPERLRTP